MRHGFRKPYHTGAGFGLRGLEYEPSGAVWFLSGKRDEHVPLVESLQGFNGNTSNLLVDDDASVAVFNRFLVYENAVPCETGYLPTLSEQEKRGSCESQNIVLDSWKCFAKRAHTPHLPFRFLHRRQGGKFCRILHHRVEIVPFHCLIECRADNVMNLLHAGRRDTFAGLFLVGRRNALDGEQVVVILRKAFRGDFRQLLVPDIWSM